MNKKILVMFIAISMMLVTTTALTAAARRVPYFITEKYDIGGSLYDGETLGLSGWSDPWTWGGNYGGADDGTFCLLMGPGDGCGDGYREAYFSIDTKFWGMDTLTLNHLDGSQDDNFELFVHTGLNPAVPLWTSLGEYQSEGNGEHWVETTYTFNPTPGVATGVMQFKLVATGEVTSWCETWGQVAFSWVEWTGHDIRLK